MKALLRWSALILVILLMVAGCDRCRSGQGAMDRAADARVSSLAEVIPADSQMVILIPDLAEMRETVDITLTRVAAFQPQIRMIEQQIARELGIRITSAESWKENGIDPEGSLVVAIVGNRPVIATYLDDRQAFEGRFVERMRGFTRTESPVRNETIGGHSFKISGDGAGSDIAWFYRDNMVVLAMPPFDAFGVFQEGTATNILANVASLSTDQSMARNDGFQKFRAGLGNQFPISVFMSQSYLARVQSNQADAHNAVQLLATFADSTEGAGIGVRADPSRLEVRSLLLGDDELVASTRELFSASHDTDWEGFLTTNTVLAVRADVDLSKAYELYMAQLPDDDRRRIRRAMTQSGRAYQIDVEDQVIGAFSGHALLTFYGLGGDPAQLMALMGGGALTDTIRTLLGNAGLVLNVHFQDEEKRDLILERLQEFGGEGLARRPLVFEGSEVAEVEVLEPRLINLIPARMFLRGDSVTVAAAAIGENAAYQYMTSARSEGLLSDSDDHPLGKEFASADVYNGVYLNFDRLRGQIRRIPMASGFANQLQSFHELVLTTGVDDTGLYGSLILDFTEPLEREQVPAQ